MVRAESDDKGNDGNLGTFGKGRMVPEFEQAAYALEAGELSEPVRTQFGWHLIQLHEKNSLQGYPIRRDQGKGDRISNRAEKR